MRKLPSVKGQKPVLFQNKELHDLETLKFIHKKIGTQSETPLLMNSGKLSTIMDLRETLVFIIMENYGKSVISFFQELIQKVATE